jgi:hypothetical protein
VVLRRESEGTWRDFGPGPSKGDPDVIGFEDLGGYGPDEMYAVGWGGEIWWCDRGRWRRVDSPTSANLRALYCADDAVYIVGHNGTMLRGRHDSWQVMDTGRREKLMDVSVYGDKIQVCTDFRLLKWSDTGLVNDTDFADAADVPATCLYLLNAPDAPQGLISLGQKDVFRRQSGPWARLV